MAANVSSFLKRYWSVVVGAPLPEGSWLLATLPIRFGGIGATDPVVTILKLPGLLGFVCPASLPTFSKL